jgi:RNA polymerase sigma-70 factor (ECF subfamily)
MLFDGEIIARLRKREEDAFTELYRQTGTMLYNYILGRVGRNEDAAEDILSEVFSDAVNYASSLTPLHNVQAWLFRIAKSKVADHFRRMQKEGKWRTGTPVEAVADRKGGGTDPAQQLVTAAERQVVNGAFALLRADYREVLRRMYVEEQSVKDIAREMKRSEKSVESLLYRARKDLEQALARLQRGLGGRVTNE